MIRTLLRPFGKAFLPTEFPAKFLLKQIIIQRCLRINGNVPWPVHWSTKVKMPENIQPGTRWPGLMAHCHLDGRNGIIFGKNVWVGPKVSIISMNHDSNNYRKYIVTDPIEIGNDCWLGAGSMILPGVKLGNHVVCAAGAVVTKSFQEDNILLVGVPARIVKKLQPYESGAS